MVAHEKIVGAMLLVLGSLLILAGIRIDFLLRHLSLSTLLITLALLLLVVAAYEFVASPGIAERTAQRLEHASPIWRLWLPARYYTAKNLRWQFRLMSIMALLSGLMAAFAAILARSHGL
jgi:hypothetical protein